VRNNGAMSSFQTPAYTLPIQFVFLILPLPVLFYLGNPAIGLLVGTCLSLATNRQIIPAANQLGKLGFKPQL
jgi:hypothetical protein